MSSKDNQDSKRSKKDSELKNPGRRQVLGVAAMAAAFTAGPVGSAAAQPRRRPSPKAPAAPDPDKIYGGLVDPDNVPGGDKDTKPGDYGYQQVSKFHDLPAGQVYKNPALYRQRVSKYAKGLRKSMGLDKEFMHVVRIEPLTGTPPDGHCGCCCC